MQDRLERELLSDLTDAQREAVTHRDGPMLVVAGAGTGKTRVVTRRVAHLVACGVPPWSILAVTFTNKAAREMRERVATLVGDAPVWVSTFHSLGARLLRRHGEALGYERSFTIVDRDDGLGIVRRALAREEIDATQHPPGRLLERISRLKQEGTSPSAALEEARSYADRVAARAYRAYEETLRKIGAMDFDDLLGNLLRLLETRPDVAADLHDRFRYLSIDEYQDTNRIQYLIAKRLAGERRNLCATGDPDQSIYAWRGADLRNILEFRDDFPDAKLVRLERNYRSTRRILAAASALIGHNRGRIERGLDSENEEGDPLSLVACADEHAEAAAVCERVEASRAAGVPLGQIAVFYRVNAQSRVVEAALRDRGIPYALVGAVAFYQRREIKDLLAYLTVAVNPAQDEALGRILNVPARGIGKVAEGHLRGLAQREGISLRVALGRVGTIEGLGRKAAEGAAALDRILAGLAARADTARGAVAWLVETLDFGAVAADMEEATGIDRAENVRELVSAAAEFDERAAQSPPPASGSLPGAPADDRIRGVAGFLEEVALLADADRAEGAEGGVWLMTLHSAKGLEFDEVLITGLEEGLLPHSLSDTPAGVEEERRLLYVGLTRARKRVTLLSARLRTRYGTPVPSVPSAFLDEIPSAIARREVRGTLLGDTSGDEVAAASAPEDGATWRDERDADPDPDAPTGLGTGLARRYGGLVPGARVRHPAFGEGEILSLEGKGPTACATVRFRAGRKTLMLSYAKLERE